MSTSPRLAALAATLAALIPVSALAQEVADEEPMPAPAPAEVEPPATPAPPVAPAAALPVEVVRAAPLPPPAGAPAAAIDSDLDPGQLQDSNIDRAFLTPTAQTQPAGSLVFSDYELLFMGLTYGVTNDFQITAMTMVPLGEGAPWVGIFSGKYRLLKTGRLRVAAQGSAIFVREPQIFDDSSQDTAWIYTLGGVASLCLDDDCASLASVTATTAFSSEGESSNAFLYSGSLVHRLNRRTKLMLEYVSAAAKSETGGWDAAEGGIASYGLRFYSGEISGDIGFMKPVGENSDEADDEMPMGFPFINFTYRAL
jgi:hypothetical protein